MTATLHNACESIAQTLRAPIRGSGALAASAKGRQLFHNGGTGRAAQKLARANEGASLRATAVSA